jgi:hypothetical protein
VNEGDEREVRLFVYGTLRDPGVQLSVFGREAASEQDALTGFRFDTISIDGKTYRTLRPAPDEGERVAACAPP